MKKLILPLLLIAVGCYSPNGGYYNADIKPKDQPKLTISLNNYDNASTINLFEQTTFSYYLTSSTGQLTGAQILFDGKTIVDNAPATGTFTIPSNLFKSGTFELKILAATGLNDGSLADRFGATAVVWKTWTLVINVDQPPAPVPTLSTENGYLKVSWAPYTGGNFTKYTVSIKREYDYSTNPQVITITEPTQSFYVDKTYVGNYAMRYSVATYTHAQSQTVSGDVLRVDDIKLSGDYRESDSTVLLKWSKADFPAAFKSYTIVETGTDRLEITNAADTVLRIKPQNVLFGLSFNYVVRTNPVSGYQLFSGAFYVERPITTSRLYPFPLAITYSQTYQQLFTYSSPNLLTYDLNFHLQGTTNLPGFTCMPYQGTYAYYSNSDGFNQKNLQTGAVQFVNVLSMTTGGILQGVGVTYAADNQTVVFNYRAHDASGSYLVNHTAVYDMVNRVKLYHLEDTNGGSIAVNLSSSGQYLLSQGKKMYHINGSVLEYLYDLQAGVPFNGMRIDNGDEWISNTGSSINIYDNATGSLKRSIPFPGTGFLLSGYDARTKNLFFTASKSNVCYAVHADTKAVTTIHAYTLNAFDVRLIAGNICDLNGYYFKAIPN